MVTTESKAHSIMTLWYMTNFWREQICDEAVLSIINLALKEDKVYRIQLNGEMPAGDYEITISNGVLKKFQRIR